MGMVECNRMSKVSDNRQSADMVDWIRMSPSPMTAICGVRDFFPLCSSKKRERRSFPVFVLFYSMAFTEPT